MGCTGVIGKSLVEKLLKQGHSIWGLSRSWDKGKEVFQWGYHPVSGDITKDNLGLGDTDWSFDAVYHLAGIVNLSPVDKDNLIHDTNFNGTLNVVKFCIKYEIPHLYYCSTAYSQSRNPYEISKQAAELMVKHCDIPKVTIYKPSLVLGGYQHFSQFVSLLIFLHRRLEVIRRKFEGTMRLPPIEPVFRIHGNPSGSLNLVTSEAVATAMATIADEGTFWLTNPVPPSLEYLAKIAGEFIMVNLQFKEEFPAMPLEIAFQKIAKPFLPYLQGNDDFDSNMSSFVLNREDIEKELFKLVK
jgi:nucleoside-diphosphate-sugar epimerase